MDTNGTRGRKKSVSVQNVKVHIGIGRKNMSCLICKQKIDKRAKKYCSKKCYFLARSKNSWYRTCNFCGNEMKVKRSDIEKYNRGKYCSKKCASRYKNKDNKRVEKKCFICHKGFFIVQSRILTTKYCCIECKNVGIGKKENKKCKNCGKIFSAYQKKKYCSQKCYFEEIFYRGRIEKICLNCKEKFITQPSYVKRNEGIFCSRKCSSIFNSKKNWNNKEWKEKQIKLMLTGLLKRPTSLEKQMISIIQKHNLPYKYTGDGSFWIAYKNPDFVNVNGEKKVIEVANDYKLHHPENYANDRRKHFSSYGWTSFIFTGINNKLDEEEILKTIQQ